MQTIYVGDLTLDNKVDITDPCYNKDVWCRMTAGCVPGVYKGYANISEEDGSKGRVVSLSIYLDGEVVPLSQMYLLNKDIGVDSGMCGFFNDKPDYNGPKWDEFINSLEGWGYYSLSNGILANSGYGDGVYNVYTNKESTAFTVVFIE